MTIALIAGETQKERFLSGKKTEGLVIHTWQPGDRLPEADAYFDLTGEDGQFPFRDLVDVPVFAHAVIKTSRTLPAGTVRINAWPGFLEGDMLEISGDPAAVEKGKQTLERLGWRYQHAPDTPGMIAARVLAMVINEAFFAFGEGISSRQEIDTAMRLGTNYPHGPFSWCEQIGADKVYALLKSLGETQTRYTIAPALEAACQVGNEQDKPSTK